MALITTAQFWKDPGFTEGAVEVPKLADCGDVDKLPDYDINAEYDLLPSKGRLFSELKAPLPFDVAQDLSYMYIEIEYDRPSDSVTRGYFGWIDSVEMIRDDETSPQVLIHWHVDLWRTYAKDGVYRSGMVRRASLPAGVRPIQNMNFVNDHVASASPLLTPDGITIGGQNFRVYWLVICTIADRWRATSPVYIPYPLLFHAADWSPVAADHTDPGYTTVCYSRKGRSESRVPTSLSTAAAFIGEILAQFGIASSAVTGAFVLPHAPIDTTLSVKTQGDVTYLDVELRYKENDFPDFVEYTNTESEIINKRFPLCSFARDTYKYSSSMLPVVCNEERYLIVSDAKGQPAGMAPNMRTYRARELQFRLSPTMCGMDDWLKVDTDETDRSIAKAEGRIIFIPFPRFPLASNSWSDYVVSGQRNYEIEQRRITADMQLIGGLTGAGTSGVSTASSAAIAGKAAAGTLGAAAGLLSASQAGIGYMVNRTMDSALQNINDSKAAMKPETLIETGDGLDWVRLYGSAREIVMKRDTYSVNAFESKLEVYGADVSIATTDCTTYMNGTGPLQIEALTVRGNIPVEAKRYIKEKMNNGVRLI